MPQLFTKSRLLIYCLALSILAHLVPIYVGRLFSTYEFAAPVNPQQQYVVVDLTKSVTERNSAGGNTLDAKTIKSGNTAGNTSNTHQKKYPANLQRSSRQPAPQPQKSNSSTNSLPPAIIGSTVAPDAPQNSIAIPPTDLPTLLTNARNFVASKSEKLTYQISMLGLPIGSAELEAKNEDSEIRITLRVRSNAAISNFYPVDDLVETRHIDGRFILTKIKQQEGAFRGDEEFTINLKRKRVSSFNNIRGSSLVTSIPTDEVLDTLSGLYYLRNRQLAVDNAEMLHIFDSETYAEVPVKILRRETMRLLNLEEIKTIVVQPLQKTTGIFRRNGDIQIWMTDDAYRVPVKVVTSITLGTVTADLVAAESEPFE